MKNKFYCVKVECDWICNKGTHRIWFWALLLLLWPVWFIAMTLKSVTVRSTR